MAERIGPRFTYRAEETIQDPPGQPIRGILFDRQSKGGRYHLLTRPDNDLVREVIEKGCPDANKRLVRESPFPVDIPLGELRDSTRVIETVAGAPEGILSAPIFAYFEVSSKCNLQCGDCYQGLRPSSIPMSPEQMIAFLDRLSRMGVLVVRFTGKEPTVHPDLLRFIRQGEDLGLKMALNTNGFISRDYAYSLAKAGIQEAVVSIDGNEAWNDHVRGKGVFAKAVQTLKILTGFGVDTRINMTICRDNFDQIEDVARLAAQIGCYVSYIPMRNLGFAEKKMQEALFTPEEMRKAAQLITHLRRKYNLRLLTYFDVFEERADYYHPMFQMDPCVARKNVFVDHSGKVYPCDHLVALENIYYGGNIVETDLLTIWRRSEGLWRYRNLKRDPTCVQCVEFGKRCHGGCTSESLVTCGGQTDTVTDRLCFLHH